MRVQQKVLKKQWMFWMKREKRKEKRIREDRQLAAMEATANNTAETNARLNRIIDNQ